MQLSKRHLAWSPLLLIGLAISYYLIEELRTEPCPQEREGRTAASVITVTFALYFLAGYWIVVTRKYLLMAVLALWAWHLLALSPVLAPNSCAQASARDRLGEISGFGFGAAMATVFVFGAVASAAMVLRYRKVDAWPLPRKRAALAVLLALASLSFGFLVIGAFALAPQFREVFAAFGADLPLPTLLLLEHDGFSPLAPLLCLVALAFFAAMREPSDRTLAIGLTGAIGLLVLANVTLSASVFALYAPVLKMCRCL